MHLVDQQLQSQFIYTSDRLFWLILSLWSILHNAKATKKKKDSFLYLSASLLLCYLIYQTLCFRAPKKPINHHGATTVIVVHHGSVSWCNSGTNGIKHTFLHVPLLSTPPSIHPYICWPETAVSLCLWLYQPLVQTVEASNKNITIWRARARKSYNLQHKACYY